jgi:N-acetyl-gamma-glutamyl-phosphate reductase
MADIRVGVLGASGYTGAELLRLLADHPAVRVMGLTGDRMAGKEIAEIYPHLATLRLPRLVRIEDLDFSALDVVFCALPHGTTQAVIRDLPRGLAVVDLSADFRLRDPACARPTARRSGRRGWSPIRAATRPRPSCR